MKPSPTFEERWKRLTSRARMSIPDDFPELPPAFHTRVLAHWQAQPVESWEDLLATLGGRAVWAAVAVCAIAAGLVLSDFHEARISRPELEHVITLEAWIP